MIMLIKSNHEFEHRNMHTNIRKVFLLNLYSEMYISNLTGNTNFFLKKLIINFIETDPNLRLPISSFHPLDQCRRPQ